MSAFSASVWLKTMGPAALGIALLTLSGGSLGKAPLHESSSLGRHKITDGGERTAYIVVLLPSAKEKSSNDEKDNDRFSGSIHSNRAKNSVRNFGRRYGFTPLGMTSYVSDSFTALLTTSQVDQLRDDPDVALVTEDYEIEMSAMWAPTVSGAETSSWGWHAVGGRQRLTGSTRKVYVIDTGVGLHSDLPNVVKRVNVACGTTSGSGCADTFNYPVVGCYAHATHVAGIIGAQSNNNSGVKGIYSGVDIVSVSFMQRSADNADNCGNLIPGASVVTTSASAFSYALDWVKWDIVNNGGGKVAIVNVSANPLGAAFRATPGGGSYEPEFNHLAIKNLATPAISYPGAFLSLAAGNFNRGQYGDYALDICNIPSYLPKIDSYLPNPLGPAATDDGIMVVGALNKSDQPVTRSTYPTVGTGFSAPVPAEIATVAGYLSGRGRCVDIWAPGDAIHSAWGATTWPNQVVGATYTGVVQLSGTSMAAPHVAGAAAYVADLYNLQTPSAIETKLRELSSYVGVTDGTSGYSGTVDNVSVYAVKTPDALVSAASRKTHAASGTFDIELDQAGSTTSGTPITTEPRRIGGTLGNHDLVFAFSTPVSSAVATIESINPVPVTMPTIGSLSFSGNRVNVPLLNVADQTRISVRISWINGNSSNTLSRSLGLLHSDVTNSRAVNSTDILFVQSYSGQLANQTNFRADVNASGGISSADILYTKNNSGKVLP